jgi:hypothetical protein
MGADFLDRIAGIKFAIAAGRNVNDADGKAQNIGVLSFKNRNSLIMCH